MAYQAEGQGPTRRCAKRKYVTQIQGIGGIARARRHNVVKPPVVDPRQEVAAVLNWPLEEVKLGTQPVVRGKHNPSSIETVLDLVFVDHLRRAKHKGPPMDVND